MYRIGQYIPGDSIVHRLDPRLKIVSVTALSIMILRGEAFTGSMISTFLVVLIPISRLTPYQILKALRPMVVFFVLLFFLHLIFTDGTPIPPFPWWSVTVTYEGLYTGAVVTWHFTLLVLSASILTMTTSPSELVSGIEGLLRPLRIFGICSHDVGTMISIALRFFPTFLEEIERVKEAQMARGADFKTGTPVQMTKAAISLSMPLITGFLRRVDDLVIAMEGRGYKGGPRTYMRELRMSHADHAAVAIMILMAGLHVLQDYLS